MIEDLLQNRSIIALFEKIGFSGNGAKCYLAALSLGSAKVSEIAKAAQVHRVNAYTAIKSLVESGLLEQEITSHNCRIHPAPLSRLQELAQDYQKHATRLRWKIEDIIPRLQSTLSTNAAKPQIIIFEGPDAGKRFWERTLSVATPGSEILEIAQPKEIDIGWKYNIEIYIPQRVARNIFIRVLGPRCPWIERLQARDYFEKRKTRFLSPEWKNLQANLVINNDEISFSWKKPHPIVVIIKNNAVASVVKMLFEMLWIESGKKEKSK